MTQRKTIGLVFAATVLLTSLTACSVNNPTHISFSEHKLEMAVGDNAALPLELVLEKKTSPSELKKILPFIELVFTSANTEVVVVSDDGQVRAVGAGNTIVTATVGELYASIEIEVHETLAQILAEDALLVTQGQTVPCQFRAAPHGALLRDVAATVEDGQYATVYFDENGGVLQIEGVTPGETAVVITSGDVSKTIAVTILPDVPQAPAANDAFMPMADGAFSQPSAANGAQETITTP